MDALSLLQITSAQAQKDVDKGRFRMGYIDDDFDPSTYPQIGPKVRFDALPMGTKEYTCLGSYYPVPGDRVLLAPVGDSFVVLGNLGPSKAGFLYPGQRVFTIDNHSSGQTQGSASGSYLIWTDELLNLISAGNDPYGFWNPAAPEVIRPTIPGYYTLMCTIHFPSVTSTVSSDRRVSIRYSIGGAFQIRGGDFYTPSISGRITSLSFTYPALGFASGSDDCFRLLCGGSVGGGQAYNTGANASMLSMYYDGPIQVGDPFPIVET